ncbi:2989_t:CDS:2 [Gigaspora margarita]|uniref:2989_t:CDS:1 n=1 Tax=Gigaspora margarita TaxID=4874 RepID=A0ABN7W6F2_GIGMA|nr:2989_t:CDS:2 [Gigaspora margarita]
MSPPLSPNKPIKSLNQQRSLPSFRSTQSQPTSPTQENSNNYPLIYNNNSNNSSPPKLKINTYPVSSNTNSNKTENNKSDDSSSPIIETFTPMSKKTSFALVSRDNLALISGWIDAMQDEEMLEDSLACKYNISNRNLIMNTTPLQHNSLFSRATYSKYAVNLCKGTGPAFGTTDLIMKDGEVTFKSDCYSLDLLKKIGGEMDNEDVKSYMIEEYEVYLLLKRR